jgi:hypothetical protein
MLAPLNSPQQSNGTCQLPAPWTNDLLAMNCNVSREPLHLVMTTGTLHHRVMGNNQPKNKPNSTITQDIFFWVVIPCTDVHNKFHAARLSQLSWKLKVHHCHHKSLLLDPILQVTFSQSMSLQLILILTPSYAQCISVHLIL